MAERLDMSLDDIIKNNKKSTPRPSQDTFRGRSRGRGGFDTNPTRGGFGTGPTRRFIDRGPSRMTPYFVPQAFHMHEMLIGESNSGSEAGTKLYISNLDYGVTNEDIKVLFSDVGDLKRYSVHYDRSGRSKGTAEVVFVRQSDAVAAMKRYNNVQLDGKPMQLELVGVKIVSPVPVPAANRGILGNPSVAPRSMQARVVGRGQDRAGRGIRGVGRGRGQIRGHVEKVSAEDLDAELEKYHLEAMQIN